MSTYKCFSVKMGRYANIVHLDSSGDFPWCEGNETKTILKYRGSQFLLGLSGTLSSLLLFIHTHTLQIILCVIPDQPHLPLCTLNGKEQYLQVIQEKDEPYSKEHCMAGRCDVPGASSGHT